MNSATANSNDSTSNHTPVFVVRQAITKLNSLDTDTADQLNALAFILMRVARADGQVCNDERLQMEEILIEHARIPAEHAVLVTEIACHRANFADCGNAYGISRELRSSLDATQRATMAGFLLAVANADGCFSTVEHHEVVQIAGELGIDPGELA